MKKYMRMAMVAGALVAAVPAQASSFLFDTVNEGNSSGNGVGNAFTYKTGTGSNQVNVKVTGWSVGFDGKFTAATLASWGANGLGIYQQGERTDGAYHQIDNVNGWEFAVLQFDRAVTLTSAVLNPFQLADRSYTDNDAFISGTTLAGSWNQTLTADTLGSLIPAFAAHGFNTDSSSYADRTHQSFAPPAIATGNIWVIGGSVNGPDNLTDAFKLAQFGGNVSAVPEPASWAMMLVGVGMMGFVLRRRRRDTAATCAA